MPTTHMPFGFKKLPSLRLWIDTRPRDGFENMAIDEWLAVSAAGQVILRSYKWQPGWGSFGHFDKFEELPGSDENRGRHWVRRLGGGGAVEHDSTSTYTFILPKKDETPWKSNSVSSLLHGALADSLLDYDIALKLHRDCPTPQTIRSADQKLRWDVLKKSGEKLAGSSIHKTEGYEMHQGWALLEDLPIAAMASLLTDTVIIDPFSPNMDEIRKIIAERYGNEAFLKRR